MSKLLQILERTALLSLEKQDKLARLVGEHIPELDLDTGMIRMGEGFSFPFQVLGTQSDNTLTWLWAWAEERDDVSERLAETARELREWGGREGVPEFSEPEIDLNRADGQMLSIISSEIVRASCYYRDPYEGGALYLLLSGREIDAQPPLDAERLAFHLRELSEEYEVNPRNALFAYLHAKDLSPREEGTMVKCLLESGGMFSMEFDELGRIVR